MITGIRRMKQVAIIWERTHRSKEYRGKRTNRITQSMYRKNEIEYGRMRDGLNESIVCTYQLRLNRVTDVPMCPMRRWK
jgi:hypothetical protein